MVVIEAMKYLVQNYPQLKYFICGQGEKKQELQQLIRDYHLEDHVKLLGFRTDVAELCQAADVFVFPSKQEGLPVALMEAMACGVPVVCSRIRGNTDLVEDEKGGILLDFEDVGAYENVLLMLLKIKLQKLEILKRMGMINQKKIERFDRNVVGQTMKNIYQNV